MPVTKPAVIVATAVAVSPAKARPIETDINTATVISHPERFITGKLPAFLGYRIPFGACNGMKNQILWREVGLAFKSWVPRTQAGGIRPLPPLPRGDGLAAEKGSLVGADRPEPGKERSPNGAGTKWHHHSGRRTVRGFQRKAV